MVIIKFGKHIYTKPIDLNISFSIIKYLYETKCICILNIIHISMEQM